MIAGAGMPAHHPNWPRKCPRCKKPADGFQVVVPTGIKDGKQTAWGLNGVACIRCQWICVPLVLDEAPDEVDQNYIGRLIYRAPWFRTIKAVQWMKEDTFNKKCCLPPEPEAEVKEPK